MEDGLVVFGVTTTIVCLPTEDSVSSTGNSRCIRQRFDPQRVYHQVGKHKLLHKNTDYVRREVINIRKYFRKNFKKAF